MKNISRFFKALVLAATFLFISAIADAQDQKAPFYNEIKTIKKNDSLSFPLENSILFVGSSSLKLWKDLEQTFKQYQVLNRGFGGSTLTDAIYYADDIIYPYNPKQIVIYSGENDIAGGASPEVTLDRFKMLFSLIRKRMPEVPVAFISIKPSVSRSKLSPQFKEANKLIKDYLSKQTATDYIDVFSAMLNDEGEPMNDIFIKDNLHMNQKGYKIWIQEIRPYLEKYK